MNLTGTGTAPPKSSDTSTERNTLLLLGGYFSLALAAFQISAVF